jgi:septal ring factor EnvC (AmiA/AmiB activator)
MKKKMININIEDYLHAIDSAFSGKSQKDIYMTYIMIFAAIFAFSYSLFWDSSFESFKRTEANVNRLHNKIKEDKRYLMQNSQKKITQLDAQIKKLNEEMIATKDNNAYIKRKIETISSLIYNERTWGEYIDSISKNAQKYNVQIEKYSNKYAKNDKHFGHVLDITIKSSANYKNTLRFINSLEQSDLVVDVHSLSIKAEKKLNTDLSISVWGITY